MNKLNLLVASALVAAVGIVTQSGDAQAQAPAPQPSVQSRPVIGAQPTPVLSLTRVQGSINVAGAPLPAAPLTGWNCDDLAVSVTSKELNPPPPGGGFASPKWQKFGKASGTWTSGTCSYSVVVVANSEFTVNVSPSAKDYPCGYIQGLNVTPGYSPAITVPSGQSKVQNFTATGTALCKHVT